MNNPQNKNKKYHIVFSVLLTLIVALASVSVFFTIRLAKFSHLTYIALGDSITYGYNSADNGMQMSKPYPQLVKEHLKLKNALNYGINGSTLSTATPHQTPMCIRYQSMPNDADIVSVMGGVNDYGSAVAELGHINDTSTNTIYGSLNTLASGLKNKYPNAYIFFITPFKWGNDPGVNAKGYTLLDIANAIKQVCANFELDVLDLYNLGQVEIDYAKPDSDKLHPSQEFFKKYTAPQIAKFIRQNYK